MEFTDDRELLWEHVVDVTPSGARRPYLLATVVYAGKPIGAVNHLIVPGVGTGWHTLCARLWANGFHTNEAEWGHRAPDADRPTCKDCHKASANDGSEEQP